MNIVLVLRWAILVTFICILLFGGVCIGWLVHLSNKTHADVVDIDRRLKILEHRRDNNLP
jgi:hypothetical protein